MRADLLRVFALALLVAFGLQWKSCSTPERMHEGWREVAHWRAPSFQEFHPDDPLVRYQRFQASPVGNLLYGALARTGIDVAWGKLNGIVWFACTAVLLFFLARGLAPGRWSGWVAALVFILFPSGIGPFVGGLMPGLAVPLLGLAILVARRDGWWWAPPLVTLQALVHPSVAWQSLLLLLCSVERRAWRRQLVPGLLALAACVLVVGLQQRSAEFGELVTWDEIGDRVEFSDEGDAELLPTPSIWSSLADHLGHASYLGTCLFAFLILGKPMIRLPRVLYALLASSVGMLVLADVLLLRLGIPSESVARGLPLFAALTSGVWVARAVSEIPQSRFLRSPALGGLLLLALVGLVEHQRTILPRGDLGTRQFRRTGLYAAVRELPGEILLGAHPRVASELPLMTGRSVVVSAKLAHPWWTEHWRWSKNRIHDVLRAHYTDDPEPLLDVTRRYGIDYWVVDRTRYDRKVRWRGGMSEEPFESWARRELRDYGTSALSRVPPEYRHWDDGRRYFIVARSELERWARRLRQFSDETRP